MQLYALLPGIFLHVPPLRHGFDSHGLRVEIETGGQKRKENIPITLLIISLNRNNGTVTAQRMYKTYTTAALTTNQRTIVIHSQLITVQAKSIPALGTTMTTVLSPLSQKLNQVGCLVHDYICVQQVYLAHQKVIFTKISDVKIKKEGRQPFRNSRANRAEWLGHCGE